MHIALETEWRWSVVASDHAAAMRGRQSQAAMFSAFRGSTITTGWCIRTIQKNPIALTRIKIVS